MSRLGGTKLAAGLVALAMVAVVAFMIAMSMQSAEAGSEAGAGPASYAQRVDQAIRDAEEALHGRGNRSASRR